MKKIFLALALLSFATLTSCNFNNAQKPNDTVQESTNEEGQKEDNPDEDGEHTVEFGWL